MSRRIAALLLTGGASTRLGADKAALLVDGEPMAVRTARLLHAVASPVVEVGPGYTWLPRVDDRATREGPLAAVAAAVTAGVLPPGASALVLAVDMPALTPALLALLACHPTETTVVPADGNGRLQPLCARYSATALAAAPQLVAGGRRAMMALVDAAPFVTLHPADWQAAAPGDPFTDIDTPADLDRLGEVV